MKKNTKPLPAEATRAAEREISKDSVHSTSNISPVVWTSTLSAKGGKDIDVPVEIPMKLELLYMKKDTKPLSAEAARAVEREHSKVGAVEREHSKDFIHSPSYISPVVQTSTLSAKGGKDIDVPAEIPRKLEILWEDDDTG